ncbi:MAG: hypothetical protein ACXVDD_11275, partial [Polyangia bacterium]
MHLRIGHDQENPHRPFLSRCLAVEAPCATHAPPGGEARTSAEAAERLRFGFRICRNCCVSGLEAAKTLRV